MRLLALLGPCCCLASCLAAMATVARATEDGECAAAGSAGAFMDSFDKFELTYFDGRGLAEVPRTLFAVAGRFPGAGFTDIRLTREQFNAKKDKHDLLKNLNRVPILKHNGALIGQSAAISRYLSRHLGLMGKDEAEAAQIDAMCEHLVDVKAAYRKVFPYKQTLGAEQTEARQARWFDTPAAPPIEGRKERQLQWFLAQLEGFLPGDGFAVGGRPSLADAYLYNMLGEHAPELGTKGEPFESLEKTRGVLARYPKLAAVVSAFRNTPGMTRYLSTRGEMGF